MNNTPLTEAQLALITDLRHALHAMPEVSGREVRTRAMLIDFLRTHTTLELCPCGDGIYAAHREPATDKPAIALRADYDALATPDGGACHFCGHDGHAAALSGRLFRHWRRGGPPAAAHRGVHLPGCAARPHRGGLPKPPAELNQSNREKLQKTCGNG